MKHEDVEFKITLSAKYWDKKPMYKITVGDIEAVPPTEFDGLSDSKKVIEFTVSDEISDTGEITTKQLKVHFLNKEPTDTKKDNYDDPDNFKIIDDMLLTVEELEIDGINLPIGAIHDLNSDAVGYYLIDEPVDYNGKTGVTRIQGCNTMGWNGAYCFDYGTPVYLWILEQY